MQFLNRSIVAAAGWLLSPGVTQTVLGGKKSKNKPKPWDGGGELCGQSLSFAKAAVAIAGRALSKTFQNVSGPDSGV